MGESGNAASVIIGSDDDSCTAKTTSALLFPPHLLFLFTVSSQAPFSYFFSQSPLIPSFLFQSPVFYLSTSSSLFSHLILIIPSCLLTVVSCRLPVSSLPLVADFFPSSCFISSSFPAFLYFLLSSFFFHCFVCFLFSRLVPFSSH